MYSNFYLFLGSVVLISMSGVMMPGPVLAVSIAKGHRNGAAGALVALGHGLLEFPLMALIFLGFSQYFTSIMARLLISLVGGAMLLYMGLGMFNARGEMGAGGIDLPYGSVPAGFATTGSNPYFYLWWATIGTTLLMNASIFGRLGLVIFAFVHWLCDFFWYSLVSLTTFKSRKLWTERTHEVVFGGCGLLLMAFGTWFIVSAL